MQMVRLSLSLSLARSARKAGRAARAGAGRAGRNSAHWKQQSRSRKWWAPASGWWGN